MVRRLAVCLRPNNLVKKKLGSMATARIDVQGTTRSKRDSLMPLSLTQTPRLINLSDCVIAKNAKNHMTATIIQSPTTRKTRPITEVAFGIRGMTSVIARTKAINTDEPTASCVSA